LMHLMVSIQIRMCKQNFYCLPTHTCKRCYVKNFLLSCHVIYHKIMRMATENRRRQRQKMSLHKRTQNLTIMNKKSLYLDLLPISIGFHSELEI
jgi:hypothetical protein